MTTQDLNIHHLNKIQDSLKLLWLNISNLWSMEDYPEEWFADFIETEQDIYEGRNIEDKVTETNNNPGTSLWKVFKKYLFTMSLQKLDYSNRDTLKDEIRELFSYDNELLL